MVEYTLLLDELKSVLKRNGLKHTKQREAILKTLYTHNEHHTPEEILQLLKSDFPNEKIGIATVYRTLALFEEEGLVESISFGKDGKKYEIGHKKHHDHLICVSCGKIIEFIDEIIEKQQEIVAKNNKFYMIDHSMKIVGYCEECYKKEGEKS